LIGHAERLALGATLMCLAAGCGNNGPQPLAEYDKKSGKLTKLSVDINKNGVNDTVSYMDGAKLLRVEQDADENGQIERWEFYQADGKTLDRLGLASRNDGVMDAVRYYDPAGELQREEKSTGRDGVFDTTEFYEGGVLVRSQADINKDGRPDKWDTFGPVATPVPGGPALTITSTAFDDSGSGRPERRLIFGPDGGDSQDRGRSRRRRGLHTHRPP
jgi:hypothetical protein